MKTILLSILIMLMFSCTINKYYTNDDDAYWSKNDTKVDEQPVSQEVEVSVNNVVYDDYDFLWYKPRIIYYDWNHYWNSYYYVNYTPFSHHYTNWYPNLYSYNYGYYYGYYNPYHFYGYNYYGYYGHYNHNFYSHNPYHNHHNYYQRPRNNYSNNSNIGSRPGVSGDKRTTYDRGNSEPTSYVPTTRINKPVENRTTTQSVPYRSQPTTQPTRTQPTPTPYRSQPTTQPTRTQPTRTQPTQPARTNSQYRR